jgi:5'-3' exonuclease/transcription antitermination factor NusG
MSEWVVLELSPKSEGEDPDALKAGILQSLKQPGEVFVPAAVTQVGGDRVIHYLMEGYAFIRKTLPDTTYFKLEGTRFVQAVLTKTLNGSRLRVLATVSDAHIDRIRSQIDLEINQGIGVGDTVVITSGHFKHIEATVIEDIPEQDAVQVYIKLRSKQTIITLPRSFLQVSTRSPLSPLLARLGQLRVWVHGIDPVFSWQNGFDTVLHSYQGLTQLNHWNTHGSRTYSFIRFFDHPLEKWDFPRRVAEIERLSGWLTAAASTSRFIKADKRIEDPVIGMVIESRILELAWFEDVLDRGRKIRAEMNELLRKKATRRRAGAGKMPQNIIVDGHNLAFRCLYAPGMAELADSQGRPTGVILGFLRSLGALRKRFSTSALYVSWDGSSRRRKDKYPEYKANRPLRAGSPSFDQMGYLRKILPCLGIYQVFNPNEEADDVIATLVRKKLSSQKTVIFGTDRDFLQIVSENVSVLIPAIGSRKELLFDPEAVEEHYGVKPTDMVQLRALTGDSSDNLPGVPRVPKKILKALVQAHGTVEALYRSGLTGLTKVQYERLRSAEPQVRINVDLMTLRDVPFTKIDPDSNPDEVAAFLRAVEINPNSILETFFERSSEIATGLTL